MKDNILGKVMLIMIACWSSRFKWRFGLSGDNVLSKYDAVLPSLCEAGIDLLQLVVHML